jgi:hypothetical protein
MDFSSHGYEIRVKSYVYDIAPARIAAIFLRALPASNI